MKVRSHLNNKQGLYDPANEHDACGVGLIVNVHGGKSHGIVESALKVLENMRHRGAEGADNKTGDGAGILLQIPHEFILLQGIPVPEKGKYGTGLLSERRETAFGYPQYHDRRDRKGRVDLNASAQSTCQHGHLRKRRTGYRAGYQTGVHHRM